MTQYCLHIFLHSPCAIDQLCCSGLMYQDRLCHDDGRKPQPANVYGNMAREQFSTGLFVPLSPDACMPEPNIAAFIEPSSRGVCSRGTSTHGKQHAAAWAADHDCCVATWVSHLAVLGGSTRFSQPHRFNVPFCSWACHRSCPARAVGPGIACNILALDVAEVLHRLFDCIFVQS